MGCFGSQRQGHAQRWIAPAQTPVGRTPIAHIASIVRNLVGFCAEHLHILFVSGLGIRVTVHKNVSLLSARDIVNRKSTHVGKFSSSVILTSSRSVNFWSGTFNGSSLRSNASKRICSAEICSWATALFLIFRVLASAIVVAF